MKAHSLTVDTWAIWVSEYISHLPTIYSSSLEKIWQHSAIKSAVAKACGHMKASFLSCAGDRVWERANVPCTGKSSFITNTSKQQKKKICELKMHSFVPARQKRLPLAPVQDYQALTSNRFFLSPPAPIKRCYCVKCQRKKRQLK